MVSRGNYLQLLCKRLITAHWLISYKLLSNKCLGQKDLLPLECKRFRRGEPGRQPGWPMQAIGHSKPQRLSGKPLKRRPTGHTGTSEGHTRCSRVWRNRVSVLPGPVLTPDFRKPPPGLLALATLGKTSLRTKARAGVL